MTPVHSLRAYKNVDIQARFIIGAPTNVIVNFIDKNGEAIKSPITISKSNGLDLYEEQAFKLEDSYKEQFRIEENNTVKLYLYDSADKTEFASLGKQDSNIINLTFTLDGVYDAFEDFNGDTLTPDHWGFTEGSSGNVALKDGALGLFLNGGIKKETSDIKKFESEISSAAKVSVRFDWRSDAAAGKGRYSFLQLTDSDGNVIFSLSGNGAAGIEYTLNQKAESNGIKVASTASDWIRVKLDIDFDTKKISGTIVNIQTNKETAIAETTLTKAANLAALSADYGYSAAPQLLDNFGIRYTVK